MMRIAIALVFNSGIYGRSSDYLCQDEEILSEPPDAMESFVQR